jgi:hypothetical protein
LTEEDKLRQVTMSVDGAQEHSGREVSIANVCQPAHLCVVRERIIKQYCYRLVIASDGQHTAIDGPGRVEVEEEGGAHETSTSA